MCGSLESGMKSTECLAGPPGTVGGKMMVKAPAGPTEEGGLDPPGKGEWVFQYRSVSCPRSEVGSRRALWWS